MKILQIMSALYRHGKYTDGVFSSSGKRKRVKSYELELGYVKGSMPFDITIKYKDMISIYSIIHLRKTWHSPVSPCGAHVALIRYVCREKMIVLYQGEQEYLRKPQGKFQIFDGKREINAVCMKIERMCVLYW